MANATFVEDWNSIIPHKIKASELEHPTESFVFRCLMSFLKMMKYDVTEFQNMYNEHKDITIIKRTRLVAVTNQIYQLCLGSKQSNFFYVDLIKPPPKKTIHVLNILLNYLLYVNMVRDNTVERATSCTAKYFELSAKMNQQQSELEDHRIKLKNIEQNITKMKDQLPVLTQKNEMLREKKKQLQQKSEAIKAADSEFAEKISKLKSDYYTLQEQRVEDEEAAALIQKNEELEMEIKNFEKQEKNLQLANSEYSTLVSEIKPCILVAEEILQNPLDISLKTIKNEVDTLKLNCKKLDKDYAKKKTILEAMERNCEAIQRYVEEKSKQISAIQKSKRKTERQTNSDLSTKQLQLDELQDENTLLMQQIQALKEEILLILQMADDTMKFLMRDPV